MNRNNVGLASRVIPGIVPMLLVAGVLAAGCEGDRTVHDGLFLEVTSEPGVAIEALQLHVVGTYGERREVAPRGNEERAAYRFDLSTRNIEAIPFQIKVLPGTRFQGAVKVVAIGLAGGTAVARAWVDVDLADSLGIPVRLVRLPDGCDLDGDGFPACGRAGCCNVAEPFPDCDDRNPLRTPVGFEDECSRCGMGPELAGDDIDDDCDGVPAQCLDEDGDGHVDCLPVWCEFESPNEASCEEAAAVLDCDPGSPLVNPSTIEKCNAEDDNCDGRIDEGFLYRDWNGSMRGPGESCGIGACAGGIVACHGSGEMAVCSTGGAAAVTETCGNDVDDDCNGMTDEGCADSDTDGDGVPDTLEDEGCPGNPWAKYHSETFPLLGEDFPVHVIAEPCCPLSLKSGDMVPPMCDRDCDGIVTWCASDDGDGDGYPSGPDTDCDDDDARVHAGAWEKCGDGIDQDCRGGDLPCSGLVDSDGDGFSVDNGDCNDHVPEIHPWAQEACNGVDDNCDGLIDEGNPGGGGECGSDVGECRKGVLVCVRGNPSGVLCLEDLRPVDEACNGLDDDCDAGTDEAFRYDEETGTGCVDLHDTDRCGGAPKVGEPCHGIGECGAGLVECLGLVSATCSTNPDGSNSQAGEEVCNGRDDDCDGVTDNDADSSCNDGLACTRGYCDSGECRHDLIDGWCLINGVCVTDGGRPDGNPCRRCDPELDPDNWTNEDNGTSCDADGDGCTHGDSCQVGVCAPGIPRDCSGLNAPCLEGVCVNLTPNSSRCDTRPRNLGGSCDDGQACSHTDVCKPDGQCEGQVYQCITAVQCLVSACNGTGPANQGGCTESVRDGWCRIAEACRQSESINPANSCEACVPASSKTAWTRRPDETTCNDNNACTNQDACDAGVCKGQVAVTCDSMNPVCDPSTGTCHCRPGEVCDSTTADRCNPASGCRCGDDPACSGAQDEECLTGSCVGPE
jgi:hypothetical protein